MSLSHYIENECKKLEALYPQFDIRFVEDGENKEWGDLRYNFFEARSEHWQPSYGDFPVFGCYPKENLICAIEDINNKKLENWLKSVETAMNICHFYNFEDFDLERVKPLLPDPSKLNLFDMALQVSLYIKGNLPLSQEFLNNGEAFSFPINPSSKYSTETTALIIPDKKIGFYRMWWVDHVETRRIPCETKEELIAQVQFQEKRALRHCEQEGNLTKAFVDEIKNLTQGPGVVNILERKLEIERKQVASKDLDNFLAKTKMDIDLFD